MARKKKEQVVLEQRELELVPIGKASEEAIIDAASYLNNHRALAYTLDGCKPSYRRLIWAALKYPKGVLQPSVEIINSMASYHPHSLDGIIGLHSVLVKSGIFSGKGSFGTNSILGDKGEPAAPRYTKSALSELYCDIIKPLLPCVPKVESPVGPEEVTYIPLPVPLCFICKTLISGIGYGTSTAYPNFSAKSLYLALINDDPNYLEPNVDLLLDKEHSELQRLWETGKGRVIYSYKLSEYKNEDGKCGFLFQGSTDIFSPNFRKIDKYVEKGEVFIEDMTTKDGPAVFVGLVNNRGSLKIDDLEKLCRQSCFNSTVYNLNVTDGKSSFRVPLRDWLKYVHENYINLVTEVNKREIEKVKHQIDIQTVLPKVANYVLNENPKASDNQVSDALGIPVEFVSEVMSKPIGYLRNTKDNSDRIKGLKDKLKELKNFNAVRYTEEIIDKI